MWNNYSPTWQRKRIMELGFVEKVYDPSVLSSSYFPSKVGGKPAWLDPQELPRPESVSCGKCRSPLIFLLQVYAPLSDGENDSTFHRSIFLFMCKDPKCHQENGSKCFRVLRCQLPKVNNFYSACSVLDTPEQLDQLKLDSIEPPSQDDTDDTPIATITVEDIERGDLDDEVKIKPIASTRLEHTTSVACRRLCVVCGMSGPMSCAKCKQVNYCSKEHQIHDWRSGHKLFCPELAKSVECTTDYEPSARVILSLFEIVTEPEPLSTEVPEEKSVEQRMADYHKVVKTKNLTISEVKQDEPVKEKKRDKQFKAFKKRVALEPEQVSHIKIMFCVQQIFSNVYVTFPLR